MPAQTGRSVASYTFDVATQLTDGLSSITTSEAGEVAAAAQVLDFGNVNEQGVTEVAYTKGSLVIDILSFDFTTGDETALLIFQLSDDADADGGGFDAGDTIVNKVAFPMGDVGGIAGSAADDDSALGRVVIEVDNEHKGTIFRFARMFTVTGGMTPILTYSSFLAENL